MVGKFDLRLWRKHIFEVLMGRQDFAVLAKSTILRFWRKNSVLERKHDFIVLVRKHNFTISTRKMILRVWWKNMILWFCYDSLGQGTSAATKRKLRRPPGGKKSQSSPKTFASNFNRWKDKCGKHTILQFLFLFPTSTVKQSWYFFIPYLRFFNYARIRY